MQKKTLNNRGAKNMKHKKPESKTVDINTTIIMLNMNELNNSI